MAAGVAAETLNASPHMPSTWALTGALLVGLGAYSVVRIATLAVGGAADGAFKSAECVFVTVTIPDEKEADFLAAMDVDIAGSRKEEGCLDFDLVKGEPVEGGCKYHFCEVYKDSEAAAFHKTTDHYKAWADFKAANTETVGASQTVSKGKGAFNIVLLRAFACCVREPR
jgi:autoinducer 2-degrading protein